MSVATEITTAMMLNHGASTMIHFPALAPVRRG
ncbi:hypothetical protein JOF29_002891 [Kribbella aluminosa]|uniref:Uncharacterized protein n=1 Tax=Kribbella aluminosa TaxID=416017 RepID=A0ABS4UJL2_9ACTN|nr:hypothetical protein [Kribbella aluminosa]